MEFILGFENPWYLSATIAPPDRRDITPAIRLLCLVSPSMLMGELKMAIYILTVVSFAFVSQSIAARASIEYFRQLPFVTLRYRVILMPFESTISCR